LLRPVPGSLGGLTNDFNTAGSAYGASHRIIDIDQPDGTPAFGHTTLTYDTRGSRASDDNAPALTHDDRTYKYDSRRNVINVRGQYHNGSAWHYYDVTSAFDSMNRRVFKSFYDETSQESATWYYYYDPTNRLTEVVYTPDASALSTYSVFQLIWLEDRLVAYWQTDYPSATTSKRYVGTDETGRPIDMWNWPATGDTTRVWSINPDAWGFDKVVSGSGVFQPILFAGQYQDRETAAYENDGVTVHRPGLALNGLRTYDPFVGGYLQVDGAVNQTWNSYGYANGNPVGRTDPAGLAPMWSDGTACGDACLNMPDPGECTTWCESDPSGDDWLPGGPGDLDDYPGWDIVCSNFDPLVGAEGPILPGEDLCLKGKNDIPKDPEHLVTGDSTKMPNWEVPVCHAVCDACLSKTSCLHDCVTNGPGVAQCER
jgi:RHS repeat-associated protein